MLLNSGNLKILLGNSGPRKKEDRSATDMLIKTIVREEMCGKPISVTLPEVKKKRKKKKSHLEIEGGIEFARMRILATNNLFTYAECFGIPFQHVDIIEKQYFIIRQNVQKTRNEFLHTVEKLFGKRSYLTPSEIIVTLESIGIGSNDGRELYEKLARHFHNSPQSCDDAIDVSHGDNHISIHDILQILNVWATGNLLVGLLGHKFGFDISWEKVFDMTSRSVVGSISQSGSHVNDFSSKVFDDLQSIGMSYSSSIHTNARSYKYGSNGPGKLMKSKSSVISISPTLNSTSSYTSELHALRQELEVAKNGVDKLNKLVDMNIAWVQSNCDISHYASHFSSRAKFKCQKMATERIFRVLQGDVRRTLFWAMHRWKNGLLYDSVHLQVQKYCKIKSIHMLTVSMVNLYLKFLSQRWSTWLCMVRLQIRIEKDTAASVIQSVIRRYLSKVRLTKLRLGKTAVVIQNLFRKVKAVKVMKEKVEARMNVYAAMAIQKLMKRLIEIRKAKAELHRRKAQKAATKIQKVFRGMKGRERFQRLQENMQNIKIAELQMTVNPDIDALAAALTSSEKVVKKKKILRKVIPIQRTNREVSKNLNASSLQNKNTQPLAGRKTDSRPVQKPVRISTKHTHSKTPHAVKTVEIEIQTDDFEWPPLNVELNNNSSVIESSIVKIVSDPPVTLDASNVDLPYSSLECDDGVSVEASVKSQSSDEAVVLIQKVARGKIARKKSIKVIQHNENPKVKLAKSPDDFNRSESSEAVTKIQKVARGKLARSKKDQEQPADITISKQKDLVPTLPVESVALEDKNEKSENLTESSSKSARVPSPNKSSRTVKSERSSRSPDRVVDTHEHETESVNIEQTFMDAHIVEGMEVQVKSFLPESRSIISDSQITSSDHVTPSKCTQESTPPISENTEMFYPDISTDLPAQHDDNSGNSSVILLQPNKRNAVKTDDATHVEQQTKGLLSDKSLKSPSIVPSSLGFFKRGSGALDRPHTTNSLERNIESQTENNIKPHTAPMKAEPIRILSHGKIKKDLEIPIADSLENRLESPDVRESIPDATKISNHIHLKPQDRAALIIQRMVRSKLARKKVNARRHQVMRSQKQLVFLILWAVVSVQRVARGRQGRKRFKQKELLQKTVLTKKQNISAIKLQAQIRRFLSIRRVQLLRTKEQAKRKQREWLESLTKKSISQPNADTKKNELEPVATPNLPSGDSHPTKTESSQPSVELHPDPIDNAKLQEIDSKLKMLEDIERRIKESEEKVRQEALKAEERLQEQIRLLEERTRQAEAERLAREELMKLAVGPVSHRSPFNTHGSVRGPPSARRDNKSAYSTISSAPPTGRSAKDGPIPANAPRLLFGGQEWVQLWDQENRAYYWWCEKTKVAQWEQPGMMSVNNEVLDDREDAVSESGYESTGGMTDYSTDHEDALYGSEVEESDGWTEYWDEQAQAKYWYNNRTGEASWTLPDSMRSAESSISGSTASRPGFGNGWTSYIDDETGQMYWHNIETGEVQWDY